VLPVDADHANAAVKFDNTDEAKLFRVQLSAFSGAWKIHEIGCAGEEGTLRTASRPEIQQAKRLAPIFGGNYRPVVG
jgi:hypothetical protein